MEFSLVAIAFIAVIFSTIPLYFSYQFYKFIKSEQYATDQKPLAIKASLIIPCKGLDPGFEKNIIALFKQDYSNYELIFVTATVDDPAYEVIKKTITKNLSIPAKQLIAGIENCRSEKINNQICGIANVSQDSKVFVFIDSDARPDSNFLKNIITPLLDKSIGITTGFRWYLPSKGKIFSTLRSAWNGGGLVFLSNPKSNYAWGGAMAILKETFYNCYVLKYWENTLSDDMTISLAIRKHGLKTHFVSKCLVVIYEDCNFKEMMEWTNRQTIISKVYHPGLWYSIMIVHGIGNLIFLLGVLTLIFCSIQQITNPVIIISALLMLSIIPMEMINALFLLPAIVKMIPKHKNDLKKQIILYCLLAPFASFLALTNSIISLFTRKITWRGTTYYMKSINETIVCCQNE